MRMLSFLDFSSGAVKSSPFVVGVSGGRILICEPFPRSGPQNFVAKLDDLTFTFSPPGELAAVPASLNTLENSDFSNGKSCWKLETSDKKRTRFGVDFSPEWTLNNGHTAFLEVTNLEANARILYSDPEYGMQIPVKAETDYRAGGAFGLHRCDAKLVVEAFDDAGALLQAFEKGLNPGSPGGKQIEQYSQDEVVVHMPAGAARARFAIAFIGRRNDHSDHHMASYVFFTNLFFGPHMPGASLPWSRRSFDAQKCYHLADRSTIYQCEISKEILQKNGRTVRIVGLDSGSDIDGSPIELMAEGDISGEISRLENTTLHGKVHLTANSDLELDLKIDGRIVAGTRAEQQGQARGARSFTFRIPSEYCDGRAHHLVVATSRNGTQVAQAVEIIPHVITSWESLRKFGGYPLPSHLDPNSSWRYRSLLAKIGSIGQHGANAGEQRRIGDEIVFLHETLVKGFATNKDFRSLSFPHHAEPLVSVVVPVHNNFAVTYHCLAALLFAANKATFEVIIVDDGSSDRTCELPDIVSSITYVRNEQAEGFVKACNKGAAAARGKYIAFLNNDTEPAAGWIDELLFVFNTFSDVGLAGSKLVYPDGRLQEAGGIVWGTGMPWNYGRLGNANDPKFNYTRQVDYISGAAIMLPVDVWRKVGGFGEEFAPGYYEDTDLAFKVRDLGLKTVYAPLSHVIHFEGVSSGTSTDAGMKRFQVVNAPKFKRKWSRAYRNNGAAGVEPDLAKDRGIFGRALVLDVGTPRPDIDAGSYAALQEIRLLQALGFKVTFAADNIAYLGKYTEYLQRLGVEVAYAPFIFGIRELLDKRGREFDIVYVTRYYLARGLIDHIRATAPRAKVLFCNADLHFLRELRAAIHRNDNNAIKAALRVRDDELAVMQQVDVTLSYNEVEHAVIQSHNHVATKVVKCPWVVDVAEASPPFEARRDIAFLGGFGHPPNVEAVEFFAGEVMPGLSAVKSDLVFRVYGSNAPEKLNALAGKGVSIEGYVERVEDVYNSARIFIAPLLSGAGVKGKVIGAMAAGIPVVLSPVAAEGIGVRHGHDCLIAETPKEWIAAISRLYDDAELWRKLTDNARQFIAETYSFEKGRELMRRALESVGVFVPEVSESLYPLRALYDI